MTVSFQSNENSKVSLPKAILLLDQAVKLDTNYFTGYWNKFIFQNQLKEYDKAVVTGKQLIRLQPGNAFVRLEVGKSYERMGDTVTAMRYYNDALALKEISIKGLDSNSEKYRKEKASEVEYLIICRQQQKATALLKVIYNAEKDSNYKQVLLGMLNMNRNDLMYTKEVSTTTYNGKTRTDTTYLR